MVAAVAGDEGFDGVLSIGVFDGSGEWTAEMGWMRWRREGVAAAGVVAGKDLRGWIWKGLVGRRELVVERAILVIME